MPVQSLDRYIVATPGTCSGKPRIAGRRITVQNIAIWHEQLGKSVDEICDAYDLEPAEVHAALAYYFDHRADIDRSVREGEAIAAELRLKTPSLLDAKLTERSGE